MNEILKAKEMYNSIGIPSELSCMVGKAVEDAKKNTPHKVSLMRIVPMAACVIICLVIGFGHFRDFGKIKEADVADAEIESAEEKDLKYAEAETGDSDSVAGSGQNAEICADLSSAECVEAPSPRLGYNTFIESEFDESIKECLKLESAEDSYAEIKEIYSDRNVLSYSVTTYPSNFVRYYNINQFDGSDITLESLVGEEWHSEVEFYIKAHDKVVIIENEAETEITIK